jgi:hypothetical protein
MKTLAKMMALVFERCEPRISPLGFGGKRGSATSHIPLPYM